MAITNGYATLAEARAFVDYTASYTADDSEIETAVEAASRLIDQYCGRVFYQEAATAKIYTPRYGDWLEIEDLYNTTSLAVKTDTNGDGTFDTTWTVTTDYLVEPGSPHTGWPYTSIRVNPRTGAYTFPLYPQAVEVTGNYGWSAVPEAIQQACLIQMNLLHMRRTSPFGVAGSTEVGVAFLSASLDPSARVLLDAYRKMVPVIG